MQDSRRESDTVLVAHAQEGDRAAFGRLVRRYQDAICAIAYSRLGDVESAYDVAQEAFVHSLENLRQLRSGSKFGPWLRRITRRLCNRWQRSETYRRALRDELRQRAPARTSTTPEDILAKRENGVMVRHVVERLPLGLREVLVLHYFRGQSYAETARSLGISQAAVRKRLERAKRRVREYVTSEIEAKLRKARPGDGFAQRTLAAIPAGSICAKLSINVARVGVAGMVREFAQAAAQHASTILTAGGIAMTAKKAIVTASVLVLLAAGGTGYLVVRSRQGGARQVTELVPDEGTTKPDKSLPDHGKNWLSRKASSEHLTVEEINELILEGSPELDEMDEETRMDLLRHLLRDAIEGQMSFHVIEEQFHLAYELWQAEKYTESLAIYLAVYDVASSPDNMGQRGMGPNRPNLAVYMTSSAFHVSQVSRLSGREWDAEGWASKVMGDIDELLAGVAFGSEKAALMLSKSFLEDALRGIKPDDSKKPYEAVGEYLEEYLRQESLTPQDRWGSSALLASVYGEIGRYDAALAIYEQLRDDCEVYGYPGRAITHSIERVKGDKAVAVLPLTEQKQIEQSMSNLSAIVAALRRYAKEHDGIFPPNLEELVRAGHLREAGPLLDPFTGTPYQYIKGLGRESDPYEVVARTQTRNGLSIQLSVGGIRLVKVEE